MIKYIPFPKYERVVRRLRKLLRKGDDVQRRDALAMFVGLHGLRVEEVARLDVADLDVIDEKLTVRTIKKGKPRRVSLGAGMFRALRRYVGRRPASDPLFVNAKGERVHIRWLQMKARDLLQELLGGKGLGFHAFRHTYAMRVYHVTRDVLRVGARLGHRAIGSTRVYVEAYGELDDREVRRIGKIDAAPSLQGERKGDDARSVHLSAPRRRRSDRNRRTGGRPLSAPPADDAAEGSVSISRAAKSAAKHGKNADFREMVRAKTRSGAFVRQKWEVRKANPEFLRLHKAEPDKDLRRA